MRHFHFALNGIQFLFAAFLVGVNGLISFPTALAEAGQPELISVQPDRAANDVDASIELSGSGFSNDGGALQIIAGDLPLTQVTWVDEHTLTAVIPWGLEAGVYSLRVVNPDGGEAVLDSAFEVTQGVGQWNANAMDGGPVHTVVPIPAIPGLLYAHSGVTSAVYQSTDYGAHWETIGHAGGRFFTYDPINPNYLYINTLQSTDGGVTWREMLDDPRWPGTDKVPGGYTQAFPDPEHSGTIFLATAEIPDGCGDPSGLLRSEDYGHTWNPVETGLLDGDTNVTAMEFLGSKIFLGTRNGNLYQSENGGTTWERVGNTELLESIGLMKANPFETNELWVTTHFSVSATARIIKLDLGNLENLEAATVQIPGWSIESYPKTLGFLAEDTVFIASEWDNGWISDDDGSSWEHFQPSTGKPGYWLALDPWDSDQDTFYFADEQFGIQKTTNAIPPDWSEATWTPVNQGLHAMSPDYLEIDPANPALIYAKIAQNGWPGIFVSDDGGQKWDFSSLEPASDGVRPVTSMLAVNRERVFAGAHGNSVLGYGPQLYISDNQGGLWDRVSLDPVPEFSDSFHMPWVLKADPQQADILLMIAVIGNRSLTTDEFVSEIYRSTTNGNTWQRVNLAIQVGHAVNNLSYLAFDPNDPNIVYAAGDHEILKSTDNGRNWFIILSDPSARLNGPIAVEPVAPYRVYVGKLVSSDGGVSWDSVELPINPLQIAFVPGSDTVYAAGDGLAYSNDGGSSWQRVEGALGTTMINALAVGHVDQRTVIYVGTPGGEAPKEELSSARFHTESLSSLEAGVYRLTEVHHNVFLPLVRLNSQSNISNGSISGRLPVQRENGINHGAIDVVSNPYPVYLPIVVSRATPLDHNRPPTLPFTPSPADGSTGVDTHVTLIWSGGDPDGDIVSYDVYFDTANPPAILVADDQSGLSYVPTLAANTTYFWKVTAKDEHGLETTGSVWRFTTASGTAPAGMVSVPEGSFTRGCVEGHNGGYDCRPDELPAQIIYLDAFYIDTTEVTNGQYALCVAAGNCTAPSQNESSTRSSYYGNPTFANYPVIYVDWNQANAYCAWAGKRLPTEAEWEKAARGSTDSRAFPWNDGEATCSLANYNPGIECVGDSTAVGSYPAGASPYGAVDMAGNVYEWVNDWYSSNYYSTAPNINPAGPSTGSYKGMRGGSWSSDEVYLRVVYRDWYPLGFVSYRVGFRCAASQP